MAFVIWLICTISYRLVPLLRLASVLRKGERMETDELKSGLRALPMGGTNLGG
ncbi:MAG: hypothetical protein IJK84_01240 [Bacteroidales bacterium]|nr:hypothetical protein [Bacteroidales bacterium]